MPLFKRLIRPLSLCFELLKVIEYTTLYRMSVINESLPEMVHVGAKLLLAKIIKPARERLEASRRHDDAARTDQLAALELFDSTLRSGDSLSFTRYLAPDIIPPLVTGCWRMSVIGAKYGLCHLLSSGNHCCGLPYILSCVQMPSKSLKLNK